MEAFRPGILQIWKRFIKAFQSRGAANHGRIFRRCASCILLLAFLLLLFLVKRRSDALWEERVAAAKNLSRPPPRSGTNKAIWKRIAETKELLACSARNVCAAKTKGGSLLANASGEICPGYFQWILHDLKPWRKSGITLQMVERTRQKASFRLIVLDNRMFVETYRKCFQTRGLFTIWGLAQLLKYYPGMVPDLDLMFNCNDRPAIRRSEYGNSPPPPLFRYCGSDDTHDIAFPDWSFWGWPEVHIPPWEGLFNDIRNGSLQIKWTDRNPTAYWRGNPYVSQGRQELLKCKRSKERDWNARLYVQNWEKESKQGFRDSKLSTQCKHRYKIYVEGTAWSVSLKYIMACDSPTLMVTPKFHDFFLRGLIPLRHYWPIKPQTGCESIKFAVDWGNQHAVEAKAIGQAGSDFVADQLQMRDVYNYMLHSLTEYAKLLRYKPSVTEKAVEYCSETIICFAKGLEQVYMQDSMVTRPSDSFPCHLDTTESEDKAIKDLLRIKERSMGRVEALEKKAWTPTN